MRRALASVALCVAVLLAAPVVISVQLLAIVLAGANTAPGRAAVAVLIRDISHGAIQIDGLSGSFPAAIRIGRVTIADAGGIWLTVNGAAFDWSPGRLVSGEVSIDRLEAQTVIVARLPAASGEGGLPIPMPRVALAKLRIARLEAGPDVVPMEAGRGLALSVSGSGGMEAADTGQAQLRITAPEADGGGTQDRHANDHYNIDLSMDPSRLRATFEIQEAADGLIAGLAGLASLGAISAEGSIDGPRRALATQTRIAAGPLRGRLDGTVDLIGSGTDLNASVTAPAMSPGPGVHWASVRLDGTIRGSLRDPRATGTLSADDLAAAGSSIGSLRADIVADATGNTQVHAIAAGLRVPGPSPDLFSGGPLALDASARLGEANRPVRFSLRQSLCLAEGTVDTGGARIRVTIPDLSPFAAVGGLDLLGQAGLDVTATRSNGGIDVTLTGGIGVTGGARPIQALVGTGAAIDLAASIAGADVRLSRFMFRGSAVHATADGKYADGRLNADWTLALPDLSAIRPDLVGTVETRGHAGGAPAALSVTADMTGEAATRGERLEQFHAHLTADGLPGTPDGHLAAGGQFLGAPLDIVAGAAPRDGGFHVTIERGTWNSLTVGGTLDFASGQNLPTGQISLSVSRLGDLVPLAGVPLAGSVTASIDASAELVSIKAVVTGAKISSAATVARAALDARIADPAGQPSIDGVMTLDGLRANGISASGRLLAKGKWNDLNLSLDASSAALYGRAAHLATAGRLDAGARTLSLTSSRGTWGPEAIGLLAPARIDFSDGIAVDRLRLGSRQAELALSGRWNTSPGRGGMDVRATLSNLTLDALAAVAPELAADGTISGEARLTGSLSRPEGTIRLSASGLRARTGSGRVIPAAVSTINATLDGSKARLDARLSAAGSSVTATGTVPLDRAGSVDLRAAGILDLAMLSPLLEAQGRAVRGRLDLALGIGGTIASPRANGTIRLSNGEIQDAGMGAHLSAMSVEARVDGDTIRVDRFEGAAGQGTVSVSGTMGIGAAATMDLSLRASNARILSTDLATAVVDANLTLRGTMNDHPAVAGTITTRTVDIQVPERLPPSVAVLPLREPRAKALKPRPPAEVPDIALNVTLNAPDRVYVRGRGLDAELGGRIVFAGTASRLLPQGNLKLRRGTFNLVGQSLNLTDGTIDFSGGTLTNPQLNLVATSSTAAVTATLTISGDVKNPKLVLSSVPDLPQDEILSQLLFNSVRAKLNPFQVAEVAAALATISGVGPSGGDTLGKVRSALGLDELSVGSGPAGGAGLQAGRYVLPGVRVGATQSATGTGTQATVQVDITKGLKLESITGTSTEPVTGATTNGTSIGLKYEFEY